MTSIQIFNIKLNGDDVKSFCEMTKEQKVAFIKEQTNQKNDDIINEFLSQPLQSGDCGCGCGGSKTVSNGNIGSGNAEADSVAKQNNSPSGNGKRGANKGGKNPKTT